jgi:hypothetical protein
MWLPFYLAVLAKANAEVGRFEDARRWMEEAMTLTESTGEKWSEAEIYHLAGAR